jgi:integrase
LQTPPKVMQTPHMPRLKEGKRSGFFELDEFLPLRGALPDYAQVPVTLAYHNGMRMGEVFSLEWRQVNWQDGKISLETEDTETDEPRIMYLTDDLRRVLAAWRQRAQQRWPSCRLICHRKGQPLSSIRSAWQRACERVGLGEWTWNEEKQREVWQGKTPHDFRRTAVRNMVRSGIPEKVAMLISGHKTRSVFDRYNIVNEADLKAAAGRLSGYFTEQMGTISGTVGEFIGQAEQAMVDKSPQDLAFCER